MSHSKHNSVVTLPIAINRSADGLYFVGVFFWLGELSTGKSLGGKWS